MDFSLSPRNEELLTVMWKAWIFGPVDESFCKLVSGFMKSQELKRALASTTANNMRDDVCANLFTDYLAHNYYVSFIHDETNPRYKTTHDIIRIFFYVWENYINMSLCNTMLSFCYYLIQYEGVTPENIRDADAVEYIRRHCDAIQKGKWPR